MELGEIKFDKERKIMSIEKNGDNKINNSILNPIIGESMNIVNFLFLHPGAT